MASSKATPRAVMERKNVRTAGRSALAQSCARVELVVAGGMGGVCGIRGASTIEEKFLAAPASGRQARNDGACLPGGFIQPIRNRAPRRKAALQNLCRRLAFTTGRGRNLLFR